ncbi:MAG: hypothetical protein Q4P24_07020 [Rhodobacterales bacterium]|nr:hypothetical protein [Rhodobacterales bacterium]
MGNAVKKPIENDQVHASIMAAFERIKSVPARPTLVDTISDELWTSEDAEIWNINAGAYTDDEKCVA